MKLFSTSCETLYVGWDGPLLPRCATMLRERFAVRDQWDLSGIIAVLPARQAVMRLQSRLGQEAASHELQLQPPQLVSVGQLPELLYQVELPIAMELEQALAWASVLQSTDPGQLSPLIPDPPDAEAIGAWLELAGTLRQLHEDLASSRLSFRDVVEACQTESDRQRWAVMDSLFERYLKAIGEARLSDPHWQRRQAVQQDRCHSDRTIVLIGTSDLPAILVEMLRSLSSPLISLIAAPPDKADHFDEFGCVDASRWETHELPLRDEQLVPAGDVADQANAAAEWFAAYSQRWSTEQITIGVTDESHVDPVAIRLRGCGANVNRHLGWTINQTAVGRLMQLTANHLRRRSWQSLAALVRHADVYQFVSAALATDERQPDSNRVDWLADLDRLLASHFPLQVADPLPPIAQRTYPAAIAVADLIDQRLAEFVHPEQSIGEWSGRISHWLSDVFGVADQVQSARTAASLNRTLESLSRFSALNERLDVRTGGASAIETVLARLGDVRIAEDYSKSQVDLLGWLDLALDDSPAMIVVGLNHPFVPSMTTSDPFLPGELRTRLRVADNQRRYARDVFAMQLILSSRSDVRFVVGKTSIDRTPTPPSRLLAAAPSEDMARRVRGLLSGQRQKNQVTDAWDQIEGDSFPIPVLGSGADAPVISSISVTAFRDYLTCPYRFYLRHVLKLKPLDDASTELAANQFGDLVHAALEAFGDSEMRNESNAEKIESLLLDHLDHYTAEVYGDSVSAAVKVQISQARRRLQVFARRQAERRAEGWLIHASEAAVGPEQGAVIDVDGQPMGLKGRFDRIDRHPDGRWAVLDYKTHGHSPEKKHLRQTPEGEQWVDLQLPLYRMMIPFLGIDVPPEQVQLGYFNIAEKDSETRIQIAQFSDAQMRDAHQLVIDCIGRIRRGDFAPTDQRVPYDDYAMILQTGVASRLLDQADSSSEEVGP